MSGAKLRRGVVSRVVVWCALLAAMAVRVAAHPQVENALDVVVFPDRVTIDARVSMEQVLLVEKAPNAPADRWQRHVEAHGDYVAGRLFLKIDGRELSGDVKASRPPADAAATARELAHAATRPAATVPSTRPTVIIRSPPSTMAAYHVEYRLPAGHKPPREIRLNQSLLNDVPPWTAACVVRVRESHEPQWQAGLLTADTTIEYGCEWPAPGSAAATAPTTAPVEATGTKIDVGQTFRDYFTHGVHHILTGYDHLLFVAALVLAARKLWDLVWVVTAFTLAHTLTLTLSVLDVVRLSEGIVEPMIAGSIVVVALQNIFFPRSSRGWLRLALAFAFGLFHGLGYAGGLRDAMAELPGVALGTALVAFSVGVELAHQVVVIPLFAVLYAIRRTTGRPAAAVEAAAAVEPATAPYTWVQRVGSAVISCAGVYFLIHALSPG